MLTRAISDKTLMASLNSVNLDSYGYCSLRPRPICDQKSVLILVLRVWCCVVKHGLVTLIVIMILKDTATFQILFIVSLFCAWNITTAINSGVHLLKSKIRQVPLFTSGGLGLKNLVLFTSLATATHRYTDVLVAVLWSVDSFRSALKTRHACWHLAAKRDRT